MGTNKYMIPKWEQIKDIYIYLYPLISRQEVMSLVIQVSHQLVVVVVAYSHSLNIKLCALTTPGNPACGRSAEQGDQMAKNHEVHT